MDIFFSYLKNWYHRPRKSLIEFGNDISDSPIWYILAILSSLALPSAVASEAAEECAKDKTKDSVKTHKINVQGN